MVSGAKMGYRKPNFIEAIVIMLMVTNHIYFMIFISSYVVMAIIMMFILMFLGYM